MEQKPQEKEEVLSFDMAHRTKERVVLATLHNLNKMLNCTSPTGKMYRVRIDLVDMDQDWWKRMMGKWWQRIFRSKPKAPHEHEWVRNMRWRYGALLWECECGAEKWYSREHGYRIIEAKDAK